MPEITVSESLHEKIEDVCSDGEVEPALWEMVYRFERCNGSFE